jgi:hypothetical protein
MIRHMASTPRPAGWKGGSEDFGLLRTLDGHVAAVHDAKKESDKFGNANVRWGFEEADLSGDYGPPFDHHEDG